MLIGAVLTWIDLSALDRLRVGDANGFLIWYLPGLSVLQVGGSFMAVTSTAGAGLVVATCSTKRPATCAIATKEQAPTQEPVPAESPERSRCPCDASVPGGDHARSKGGDGCRGRVATVVVACFSDAGATRRVCSRSSRTRGRSTPSTRRRARACDSAPRRRRARRSVSAGGSSIRIWSVARVQSFVPARFRRPYAVFLHGIRLAAVGASTRGACCRAPRFASPTRNSRPIASSKRIPPPDRLCSAPHCGT